MKQDKLPVLVCCYGDYPEISLPCIELMISMADDPSRLRIYVGMNACGKRTVEGLRKLYDEGKIEALIECNKNRNKNPMMRVLIDHVEEPFFMWFDDDSHVTGKGWDTHFLNFIDQNTFDAAGSIHVYGATRDACIGYTEFLKKRDWFRGWYAVPENIRQITYFPTGGCFIARTAVARRHNFPDKAMIKRYDDMLFGELITQNGYVMTDIPGSWGPFVHINKGPRRGSGETVADGWHDDVDQVTGEKLPSLEQQIEVFRRTHQWPQPCADLQTNEDGWCGTSNRDMLTKVLGPKVKVVVELGSYCGLSARFILEKAKQAHLICVDTWEGGADHDKKQLTRLYDQFVVNMVPYRDRCTPIRATTVTGLLAIHEAGIKPDVIYIDAGHSYEDVTADLEVAYHLFPKATICGDDYNWIGSEGKTVGRAVDEWCKRHGRMIDLEDNWTWYTVDCQSEWREEHWSTAAREVFTAWASGDNTIDKGRETMTWNLPGIGRFASKNDGTCFYGSYNGPNGVWKLTGGVLVFTWNNGYVDSYTFDKTGDVLEGDNGRGATLRANRVR